MPIGRQKLFVSGKSEFEFKNKKEMAGDQSVKFGYEKNGLGVANFGPYSAGYASDLEERINYVKTPKVIDIEAIKNDVKSDAPTVSDYIKNDRTEEANALPVNDIPMIEHD